uniref:Uncharacterized protein n=1 Tax=Plectus sambesii TaxID=2011161 RepID=A0A914XE35_9BILA
MALINTILWLATFAYLGGPASTIAIDSSNFVQQRTTGNNFDTCPCINTDGQNGCQIYDPRYQASTLEEAIISFSDPSLDPRLSDRSSFSDLACRSYECQQCAGALITRFRKIGILEKNQRLSLSVPDIPEHESQCQQFGFLKTPKKLSEPKAVPTYIKETIREGGIYWKNYGGGRSRQRRQAQEQLIGTRKIIDGSCVEKGQAEYDSKNNNKLSLCPGCWAVRILPEGYFPPFINEFVCKNSEEYDSYCLSGWGQCRQQYRALHVRRFDGRGEYHNETIFAGMCCGCQVNAGSYFHKLVVASP